MHSGEKKFLFFKMLGALILKQKVVRSGETLFRSFQ